MTYEQLKPLVWPHALVPLGIMVTLDYVTLLSTFIKIGAAAYLFVYVMGFAVGLWAGLMAKAEQPMWTEFLTLNVAKLVPSITMGAKAAQYLTAKEIDNG